jgi:hypothetical protein
VGLPVGAAAAWPYFNGATVLDLNCADRDTWADRGSRPAAVDGASDQRPKITDVELMHFASASVTDYRHSDALPTNHLNYAAMGTVTRRRWWRCWKLNKITTNTAEIAPIRIYARVLQSLVARSLGWLAGFDRIVRASSRAAGPSRAMAQLKIVTLVRKSE